MKTILYIDGFNLFYSALKGTPLRWLNPVALIGRAFPRNSIVGTKYFTAKVSALPNNPGHRNISQTAKLVMTINNQPLAALHILSASNAVPRSRERERVVADRVRDDGEKHSDGERNKGEVSNLILSTLND